MAQAITSPISVIRYDLSAPKKSPESPCKFIILNQLERPLHYLGSKFLTIPELIIRIAIFIKKCLLNEAHDSLRKEVFETGYSLRIKKLPSGMVEKALKYARIYASVHGSKYGDKGWLPKECSNAREYVEDGLKMVLIDEGKTTHVVFGAVGAAGKDFEKANLRDTGANILGSFRNIYERADALYTMCDKKGAFKGRNVVCSGQCLGASLGAYVALLHNQKAFCLNALGFGAGVQWELGRDRLRNSKRLITHVSVHGDWASAPKFPFPILDFIFNILGIRTVGSYGNRYGIPRPKAFNWNIDRIHRLIISSLIRYNDSNAEVFTDSPEHLRSARAYLRRYDSRKMQANCHDRVRKDV